MTPGEDRHRPVGRRFFLALALGAQLASGVGALDIDVVARIGDPAPGFLEPKDDRELRRAPSINDAGYAALHVTVTGTGADGLVSALNDSGQLALLIYTTAGAGPQCGTGTAGMFVVDLGLFTDDFESADVCSWSTASPVPSC